MKKGGTRVQDEVNEKVVNLCIRCSEATEEVLKQAIKKLLEEMEKAERKPAGAAVPQKAQTGERAPEKTPERAQKSRSGKQSLKKLKQQGKDLSSIEITDKNIRSFEKYARKYCVDYCLKKDSSSRPPHYYVFFKAADIDSVTAAFREYTGHRMRKNERKSVRRELAEVRREARSRSKEIKMAHKKKTQEQSL